MNDRVTLLLLRAWELDRAGRTEELRALLSPLSTAELAEVPELGLLLAGACLHMARFDEAEPLIELLQVPCRAPGRGGLHRRLLNLEGALHINRGRYAEAERVFHLLEDLSREADDRRTLGYAWMNMAAVPWVRLEVVEAMAYLHRAVALQQEMGDRWLGITYYNLGVMYRELGRPNEALRMFDRCEGFPMTAVTRARASRERALAMRDLGEREVAWQLAARAARRIEASGWRAETAESYAVLSALAREAGDLAGARGHLERALAGVPTGEILTDGIVWEEAALLAHAEGDAAAEEEARAQAAAVYQRLGSPRRLERMRERLGEKVR